jgi:hypothetical protein
MLPDHRSRSRPFAREKEKKKEKDFWYQVAPQRRPMRRPTREKETKERRYL